MISAIRLVVTSRYHNCKYQSMGPQQLAVKLNPKEIVSDSRTHGVPHAVLLSLYTRIVAAIASRSVRVSNKVLNPRC
jgi:hypothetical protein